MRGSIKGAMRIRQKPVRSEEGGATGERKASRATTKGLENDSCPRKMTDEKD